MKKGDVSVHIPKDLKTQLKRKAVEEDTTIKKLVFDAVNASLARCTKQTIGVKI